MLVPSVHCRFDCATEEAPGTADASSAAARSSPCCPCFRVALPPFRRAARCRSACCRSCWTGSKPMPRPRPSRIRRCGDGWPAPPRRCSAPASTIRPRCASCASCRECRSAHCTTRSTRASAWRRKPSFARSARAPRTAACAAGRGRSRRSQPTSACSTSAASPPSAASAAARAATRNAVAGKVRRSGRSSGRAVQGSRVPARFEEKGHHASV